MIKTFSTIAIAALSISATASFAQASNTLLCPGALDQRDDPKIAAATGVALPGIAYAKEDADGECLYPHTLLSFDGADVLIVNKKWIRGPGHSDPALLSAFVLRRDGDTSRLVTVYRDFTSIGTMGEPGDIEGVKLGNDDAFYALPGGVYQGYAFTDLDISVFRGGKLVSLSALRIGASNEGAKEDEKDSVSVDGDFQFNQPEPGKLTVTYKVKNRGAAREERVVYRLEDTKWVVESGKEPSEEIQEGAGG